MLYHYVLYVSRVFYAYKTIEPFKLTSESVNKALGPSLGRV